MTQISYMFFQSHAQIVRTLWILRELYDTCSLKNIKCRSRHQSGRAACAGLPLLLQQVVERHTIRSHAAGRGICAQSTDAGKWKCFKNTWLIEVDGLGIRMTMQVISNVDSSIYRLVLVLFRKESIVIYLSDYWPTCTKKK